MKKGESFEKKGEPMEEGGFMDSLSYPKVGFGQCVIAMCCALSMTMSETSGGKRWCLGGEKTDPNKS